jgi:hypothetical protein
MWTVLGLNYHEAGIHGGPHVSAERIPTLRVEEVPEFLEVVGHEELSGSEVKPRVELVDNRLVTDDREHSDERRDRADHQQDCDADGWLPTLDSLVEIVHRYIL